MTEKEWRTCGARTQMRWTLKSRPYSSARWVRFNLACVHRVRDLIDDDRCFHLLGLIEHCSTRADVSALQTTSSRTLAEIGVTEAIRDLWQRRSDSFRHARIAAARALLAVKYTQTFETSEMVAVAVGRSIGLRWEERRKHCSLLREIFGNPFRPVTFSSEWHTATVVALAKSIDESRDFFAMPILADALQDAGCDSEDILTHCRDEKHVHVRGCWVVDAMLGKE